MSMVNIQYVQQNRQMLLGQAGEQTSHKLIELITFATCCNLAPGRQITFVFRNLSLSMCFRRLVPTTTVRSGLWVYDTCSNDLL